MSAKAPKEVYRIIYGETMAAWHRDFTTAAKAADFIRERLRCGDIVFYAAQGDPVTMPLGALSKENLERNPASS